MPSVATGDRKQLQYIQIVFSNKTRSYSCKFWNSIDAKTSFGFLQICEVAWQHPLTWSHTQSPGLSWPAVDSRIPHMLVKVYLSSWE